MSLGFDEAVDSPQKWGALDDNELRNLRLAAESLSPKIFQTASHTINAMRMAEMQRHTNLFEDLVMHTFDDKFSVRNQVLFGVVCCGARSSEKQEQ